jgi:hypothetical protein
MRSVRGDSVSGRQDTGDEIASRATELDTRPVKAKLASFLAEHARHAKAEEAVTKAEEALRAAQAAAGEIDGALDGDVEQMASLLPSIGLPRASPFKPFGLPPPSDLVKLEYTKEIAATKKLASKVSAHKSATKPMKDLAKSIVANGKKLEASLPAIKKAEKALSAAITARNTVGVDWERALGRLKNATRTAEDDGAAGLYEKLLGNPPERPKRGPRKKTTDGQASATNGAAASA